MSPKMLREPYKTWYLQIAKITPDAIIWVVWADTACEHMYRYYPTDNKISQSNKMESKTADFAPMPPPGELNNTYVLSLIRAYSLHYMETW